MLPYRRPARGAAARLASLNAAFAIHVLIIALAFEDVKNKFRMKLNLFSPVDPASVNSIIGPAKKNLEG